MLSSGAGVGSGKKFPGAEAAPYWWGLRNPRFNLVLYLLVWWLWAAWGCAAAGSSRPTSSSSQLHSSWSPRSLAHALWPRGMPHSFSRWKRCMTTTFLWHGRTGCSKRRLLERAGKKLVITENCDYYKYFFMQRCNLGLKLIWIFQIYNNKKFKICLFLFITDVFLESSGHSRKGTV